MLLIGDIMTHIYFVRHARPDLSIKDNYVRPLTEVGKQDALLACERLFDIEFSSIYSSTYFRSYQTIEEVAIRQNKKIIKIEDLKERVYGKRNIPIEEYFKRQWDDFSYKAEGGESLNDCIKRNLKVINEILIKNKDSNVLIGYHGTCLCALLAYYTNSFSYKDFLRYKPMLPLIIRMDFDGNKFIGYEEIFMLDRDYENIELIV